MTRPINHRLPVLGAAFRPPKTRGECIKGTPNTGSRDERMSGRAECLALECRYNLNVARSEDRPGRRHGGLAPEWTVRGDSTAAAPSCALDVADTGPKTPREIAAITGLDKRRIEQIIAEALRGKDALELKRLEGAMLENWEEE